MNELGEHGLEAIELATSNLTGSVNETAVRNETAARNETVVRNGTAVRNGTTEPPTFPPPTVSPTACTCSSWPTDGMPCQRGLDPHELRERIEFFI